MDTPWLKKQSKGKAVGENARKAADGTVSKAREEPVRAAAVLVFAALLIALVGWLAARGDSADSPSA